jgi:quercetin dioxygenase-like cupin family protein
MELLAWGNTVMEPHPFRIKPGGGSGESYSHAGEEFLHAPRGHFAIWLDAKQHYQLKPGDSLYFESSTPHRSESPGRTESWLL